MTLLSLLSYFHKEVDARTRRGACSSSGDLKQKTETELSTKRLKDEGGRSEKLFGSEHRMAKR